MKSLRKTTLSLAAVLLCSAGLAVSSARAQDAPPPPPPDGQMQGPPHGGPGERGPDRHLLMLQHELELSPEQVSQLKPVFAEQRAKMDALHANTALTQQEIHAQMAAIHEDFEAKIHAVLTPGQKAKYDEMQANRRAHMQGRGPGGDSAPPPPPPPPPSQQ